MDAMTLAPHVGPGKFFAHVSAQAALLIGNGNPYGAKPGYFTESHRPDSFVDWYGDFWSTERAVGWLGYDGDPAKRRMVAANERILLGVLPNCAHLKHLIIRRSDADEDGMFWKDVSTGEDALFTSWEYMDRFACERGLDLCKDYGMVPPADGDTIPEQKLPMNPCLLDGPSAVFPAFDLWAAKIDACRLSEDQYAWGGFKLATADDVGKDFKICGDELGAALLPRTRGCEDLVVWMQPVADVPLNAFAMVKGTSMVVGK